MKARVGESGPKPSENGTEPVPTLISFQPAWNQKGLYERWRMVDARETLKGGLTVWDKLQYGSFGMIAIGVMVMAFLAFQVTASS